MSECVLKTLACRGLRVGPSKWGSILSSAPLNSALKLWKNIGENLQVGLELLAHQDLQIPNTVVVNAVGPSRTQKHAQKSADASQQKGGKRAQKSETTRFGISQTICKFQPNFPPNRIACKHAKRISPTRFWRVRRDKTAETWPAPPLKNSTNSGQISRPEFSGPKKHIDFFNINFLAPTQNTPFWAPEKSLCASFLGKGHKQGGGFWGQKGDPERDIFGHKEFIFSQGKTKGQQLKGKIVS